jgi:hypothetical protein
MIATAVTMIIGRNEEKQGTNVARFLLFDILLNSELNRFSFFYNVNVNRLLDRKQYRCVPERDAGETRASPDSYFCLFFARGKCVLVRMNFSLPPTLAFSVSKVILKKRNCGLTSPLFREPIVHSFTGFPMKKTKNVSGLWLIVLVENVIGK